MLAKNILRFKLRILFSCSFSLSLSISISFFFFLALISHPRQLAASHCMHILVVDLCRLASLHCRA